MSGGNNNDVLEGGADADVLFGDGGLDALNTGDAKGDTYVEVEIIAGTSFADTLVGGDADDKFLGDLAINGWTGPQITSMQDLSLAPGSSLEIIHS